MLNIIWLSLVIGSILLSFFTGKTSAVVEAVTTSAQQAVTVSLGLVGILTLWMGIMRIAEDADLIKWLGIMLRPVMKKLFPEVPVDHPAMGAMTLNISANMLGLGNAATPFGLRAMEQLAKLNPHPGIASNAMCMFLAINTSSVQLIPATAIALLAANGDTNPTSIVFPTLIATSCSTIAAILAVKLFAKTPFYRIEESQHDIPITE